MANEALKAIQWERAKGELRAFAALMGSETSEGADPYKTPHYLKWRKGMAQIDSFIRKFENDGLHE